MLMTTVRFIKFRAYLCLYIGLQQLMSLLVINIITITSTWISVTVPFSVLYALSNTQNVILAV